MPIVISPPIINITLNGHTYTNADWEASIQATIGGIAADIAALIGSDPIMPDAQLSLQPTIILNSGIGLSPGNSCLWLSGTMQGTGTGFTQPFASIIVQETATDVSFSHTASIDGLYVNHSFSGGQANRNAINAVLGNTGATAGSESVGSTFYTAIFANTYLTFSDGGTALAPKGDAFGVGSIVTLNTDCTHFQSVIGAEFDVAVVAGASVSEKVGMQIATVNADAVKGGSVDAALLILGDPTVSAQWDIGIGFGKPGSKWNVSGTLIGTYATTNSMAAQVGIDFSAVTFSSAQLQMKHWFLDPNGVAHTTGGNAGMVFQDRSGFPNWQWYGATEVARLSNGSFDVLTIDISGDLTTLGSLLTRTISTVSQAVPASPPAGQFYVFMDNADNKLKAKGSSGTVTILANP